MVTHFGAFCFIIGLKLAQSPRHVGSQFSILWLSLINIALNTLMLIISSSINQNLSSANRFISASSFFSILIATQLVNNLNIRPKLKNSFFIYFNLVISYQFIVTNFQDMLQSMSSTKNKLFLSFALSLLVMVIIWCVNCLLFHLKDHLKLNTIINQKLKNFNLKIFIATLKEFIFHHSLQIWSFIIIYLLSFLSMILMNTSFTISPNVDAHYNIFIYTLFMRQPMILLNTFLIFLLFTITIILTKRFWISHGITFILVGFFIVTNRLKIAARDEPILPSDLNMITSFSSLLGMVSNAVYIAATVILLIVIVLIIFLEKKFPKNIKISKKIIVTSILLIILTSLSTIKLNHNHSFSNTIATSLGNDPKFFNQLAGAQNNGSIQQFLNNIDMKIMNVPTDYSKKSMQRISHKYSTIAKQINSNRTNDISKQTIIFNLSESFSDPTRVPNLKISVDSIPYIRSLKEKTTSGIMMSSGYGGGTANMEYMSLTGLSLTNFAPTLTTPFTQIVGNLQFDPAFPNLFHTTSAIHPYIGTFYNRTVAYKKLGIDKFSFLGSKYKIKHKSKIENSPYLSDTTAYKNLLDQINSKKSGQFISLATMQNHFPYDKGYYSSSKYKVSGSAVDTITTKQSIEDYAAGIHYTDIAVQNFITKIDKIDKPITIVWYGDHLPGIYSGDNMNTYESELHETDYFVYSNKFARSHGIGTKKLNYQYTDPNNFASILLSQTNSKVTPFYAFMTEKQNKFPAISVSTKNNNSILLTNNSGETVSFSNLNTKQKTLYHEYKLIQYDIVSGNNYLAKSFFSGN